MRLTIRPLCADGAAVPHLAPTDVHVWTADLDRTTFPRELLLDILSPAERARVLRYLRPLDRERAIASRALLRILLGRYTGLPPAAVPLTTERHGKPVLASLPWAFNVSHSDNFGLYAVTFRRRVGVDVERVRAVGDMDGLVDRFFAPQEKTHFARLTGREREEGFFNAWTRKEAFTKATGVGMHEPINRFAVSLIPGEPARLLAFDPDPSEPDRWQFYGWPVAPNYMAAVAVEAIPASSHRPAPSILLRV
jgi:4'-phosphopantetheinyl transferase